MVDPATLAALITAGGALGSAGIGAFASGGANATAQNLNAAAIGEQRRQNLLERMFAERLLAIQLEGQTDAFGNRTSYVPGLGFVTDLDPRVQTLQNASLREQTTRQTEDADRIRRGQRANEARRVDEGAQADNILAEIQRATATPLTENDLFQLLLSSGTQAFNREQDRGLQQVLRQSLRSGGANAPDILADFASAGADRRRDAAVDARLQAIQGADQINLGRRTNLGNLYNMFAQRAANLSDTPVAPEAISTAVNFGAQQVGRNALGAGQIGAGLVSSPAGRPVTVPGADFGLANAFGSGADAISGLLRFFNQRETGGNKTLGNQSTGVRTDAAGRVLGGI